MGAICGVVSFENSGNAMIEPDILKKMSSVLAHRGASENVCILNNAGFISRSLFDGGKNGAEGLTNEDGSIHAVMDGNIYQKEIWVEFLEAKGHIFSTAEDAELIIHLYEELGEEVVSKINGEFAFALWDANCEKLLLVKDPAGTKPLFYFSKGEKFIFASEIKSILEDPDYHKKVDLKSIINLLNFTYVPWPDTLFSDIKQIPPGCCLIVKQNQAVERQYWDFDYKPDKYSVEEFGNNIYEIIKNAISCRIEEVSPSFGALLSGGIDTTVIVGLLGQLLNSPFKVFTAGFEEEAYNELPYSRVVAEQYGAQQYEVIVRPHDVKSLLQKIVWYTDTPFFDSSAIPTYFVFKLAKEHVNTVLTGDGPDQLLAGSNDYSNWKRRNTFFRPFPEKFRSTMMKRCFSSFCTDELKHGPLEKIKKHLKFESLPFWKRFLLKRSLLSPDLQNILFGEPLKELSYDPIGSRQYLFQNKKEWGSLGQMLYYDQKHYLHDDLLVKVDRMAAANSVEVRYPFLDLYFLSLVKSIPNALKMKGALKPNKKYVLKRAFRDIIPDTIMNRRKQGFGIPFDNWLRIELKDFVYQILLDQRARSRGYFNSNILEKILHDYYSGKNPYFGGTIWALAMLEIWHQIFID